MRALASDLVEEMPLAHPVGTDAWAVGFHLPMQLVKFAFEDFGSLIQLKLREALGEDGLHLIERMGLEEIQYHRIADDELTIDRFRMAGESLGQHVPDRYREKG